MSAYRHCAAVSAVTRRFLAIPVSLAAFGRLFWQLVGCRLVLFMSAASIHGQSCISEWK